MGGNHRSEDGRTSVEEGVEVIVLPAIDASLFEEAENGRVGQRSFVNLVIT